MFTQSRLLFALAAFLAVAGIAVYSTSNEGSSVPEIDASTPTKATDTTPTPEGTEKSDLAAIPDPTHPHDAGETGVSATLAVEFPDGERVGFRVVPLPIQPDVPDGPILEHYDTLSSAANAGDSDAAFLLHRVLRHCATAYQTEEELEAAIDQLHQTHTLPSRSSSRPTKVIGTDNMMSMEKLVRENYSRCNGVTDALVEEAEEWLVMAADAGNASAINRLVLKLRVHDRSAALKYLEAAWLSGDLEAASQLGYLHANGPADQVDVVAANTYLYLHDLITEELIAAGVEFRFSPPSKDAYERIASLLMPNQMTQSLLNAKEIMKSNQNCCFSHRLQY